ncbi:MAG: spermidine/putrescine ABC transporter substrate-binding protein [Oligoflexia bacterium]|nr:spermidine/putrescine ABC transporter substrate-binding protein [Oligoflexia bacterium]
MKKILTFLVLFVVAGLWAFSKYRAARIEIQSDAPKKTLHLFAMSDYFPAKVIKDFEVKNNCQVRYDNFSNNEELLAKLQAGAEGYDVIVPSDYIVRALIASKLVMELDKSKLSNYKNLANDFVEVPYDPGSKYSVPYTWGTTGLIYNTKFVKTPIESWNALFQKEYAGHISLLDDEREVLGAMLHKLGYSNNSVKKKELEEAQKLLIKLKPSIRLFASDPKQHVLSGDIWIAQIYSGDAQILMRSNPELKYVTPKEGGTVWIDTMAIPLKAHNIELAHAFINYILEAQVNKEITEELGYSSPNKAAESLISEEVLRPSHLKKIQVGHLEFLKDLGVHSEMWDQLWTEAKTK